MGTARSWRPCANVNRSWTHSDSREEGCRAPGVELPSPSSWEHAGSGEATNTAQRGQWKLKGKAALYQRRRRFWDAPRMSWYQWQPMHLNFCSRGCPVLSSAPPKPFSSPPGFKAQLYLLELFEMILTISRGCQPQAPKVSESFGTRARCSFSFQWRLYSIWFNQFGSSGSYLGVLVCPMTSSALSTLEVVRQACKYCWINLWSPSVLVAQSWLWDSMDCSLPGSSVHGISQARILEWAAIRFSRVSSQPRDQTRVSCIAGTDSLPSEPPGKPHECPGPALKQANLPTASKRVNVEPNALIFS